MTRLPDTLRQAFRAATTGTPGPAHLELAGHQGEVEQEAADLEVIAEPQFGRVPPLRISADPQTLSEAAQLLGGAQRRIIVAGGGASTSNAGAELRELAGYEVACFDESATTRDSLIERVRLNLAAFVDAGLVESSDVEPIVARLLTAETEAEAVSDAQFVSEAIPEDLAAKQDLLARLERIVIPEIRSATAPPAAIEQLVTGGRLGIKTGQGFFDYPPERLTARRSRRDSLLLKLWKLLYVSSR